MTRPVSERASLRRLCCALGVAALAASGWAHEVRAESLVLNAVAGGGGESDGFGIVIATKTLSDTREGWVNPDELQGEPQTAPPQTGPFLAPRPRALGLASLTGGPETDKAAPPAAPIAAPEADADAETDAEAATQDGTEDATQDATSEAAEPVAEDVVSDVDSEGASEGASDADPAAAAAEVAPPLALDQTAPPPLGPLLPPRVRPPKQPGAIPASVDLARAGVRIGHGEGKKYFPDPRDCNAVYLHDDLRQKPAAEISEARRNFAGHWVSGMWDGKLCQEIVVEEIREDGSVRIADLRGRYSPWKAEPLAIRREGSFTEDDSLVVPMTGGEMTFWLSEGRMYGIFKTGGMSLLIALARKR